MSLHPDLHLTVMTTSGHEVWRCAPQPDLEASSPLQRPLVSDECSLAAVDGTWQVLIDQDFLASDCGDEWHESTAEVVQRLRSSLLPELSRLVSGLPGARLGVAYGAHLRHERPTVLVAVPVTAANVEVVREVVDCLLDYAFA